MYACLFLNFVGHKILKVKGIHFKRVSVKVQKPVFFRFFSDYLASPTVILGLVLVPSEVDQFCCFFRTRK